MFKIKKKFILNFILIFSIFALLAAYFIQYILGHIPCNLCLWERIPYILAIFIITLSHLFKKYEKFYLILLILIFLFSSLLSFYHFGIENGFFKESLMCNLDSQITNLTTEALLNELKEKTVSCADVSFKIAGLSLATINTMISLFFSFIIIKIFLNYEKNK